MAKLLVGFLLPFCIIKALSPFVQTSYDAVLLVFAFSMVLFGIVR